MEPSTGANALAGRRIALVSNTSWYLHNFRAATIASLVEEKCDVFTIAPDDDYRASLEGLGATHETWRFDRRTLSPFANTAPFFRVLSLYRRLAPAIVHHFTIKPVIMGGTAARLLGVPGVVHSVTGLGLAFAPTNVLHVQALLGYRFPLAGRAWTIFQNEDDREHLVSRGVATRERSVLIPGSGVDVERFGAIPLPEGRDRPTFLMACRMLWAKGVREFVEAARVLDEAGTDARFVLLGDTDPGSPDAVPRAWLEELEGSSNVEWRGFREDVTADLAGADVVVLPSYREGLPKTLLEGGAAGRALVTTDAPGCRDVVADGETGLLVEPRDAASLARAMERLASDTALRRKLGKNARSLVRERFANEVVVARTLAVYRTALEEEAKQ